MMDSTMIIIIFGFLIVLSLIIFALLLIRQAINKNKNMNTDGEKDEEMNIEDYQKFKKIQLMEQQTMKAQQQMAKSSKRSSKKSESKSDDSATNSKRPHPDGCVISNGTTASKLTTNIANASMIPPSLPDI